MQTLQFEAAWEKTISVQDRALITEKFQQTKNNKLDGIHCVVIRAARNYRGHFLVTVLIHNFSGQLLSFDEKIVHCQSEQQTFSSEFTIPALLIPSEISMPWTFIFKGVPNIAFSNTTLQITNE